MKKLCSACNTKKPRSEFNKRTASVDGLQAWCRSCHTKRLLTYRRQQKKRLERALARIAGLEAQLNARPK